MVATRDDSSETGSDAVAELAERHPAIVDVARAGWVARGLVHAIVGLLAIPIALRGFGADSGSAASSGGEEASQTGAFAKIAEQPFGAVALFLVGLGLALYALWRVASVALPADDDARAWLTRIGRGVSALVYAVLAWSAVTLALGSGGSSSSSGGGESRIDRASRATMEMSGGRLLVGIVGVALIVLGGVFGHRGATGGFREEIEARGVGPFGHCTIIHLGMVGWVGRGLTFVLVGWFVVRASITFDPEDASGLDGALRDATGNPLGAALALVVAVGLILYGVYCALAAPRARLEPAG